MTSRDQHNESVDRQVWRSIPLRYSSMNTSYSQTLYFMIWCLWGYHSYNFLWRSSLACVRTNPCSFWTVQRLGFCVTFSGSSYSMGLHGCSDVWPNKKWTIQATFKLQIFVSQCQYKTMKFQQLHTFCWGQAIRWILIKWCTTKRNLMRWSPNGEYLDLSL